MKKKLRLHGLRRLISKLIRMIIDHYITEKEAIEILKRTL